MTSWRRNTLRNVNVFIQNVFHFQYINFISVIYHNKTIASIEFT